MKDFCMKITDETHGTNNHGLLHASYRTNNHVRHACACAQTGDWTHARERTHAHVDYEKDNSSTKSAYQKEKRRCISNG